MFPRATINNILNTTLLSVEFCRDNFIRNFIFSHLANYGYIFFSKLRVCVFASFVGFSFIVSATLSVFISHIVSVCTKKQMFRVYTSRSVALVKNVTTLWYFSIVKLIGYTVGKGFIKVTFSGDPKHSIPLIVFVGKPQPTTIFTDFILSVKSIFNSVRQNLALFSVGFTHCNTLRAGG